MNTLLIQPSFWFTAASHPADTGRSRTRSYQIAALNIRATRANDAGEPSNRNESTDQAGGASAEILTYFVIPPADAQLIGLARVTDHSAGAVALAPPRIEVYARTDDSEQELVATAEIDRVANPPGIFFDVDLRPYAGESTELTFISRVADPAASDAGLAWLTLKLSGNEPLPPDPPESLHPERLNILIVLFDTLRADFTEPYGSEIVQTPWLSKLAADGVTFSNAWANSSWTTPSVASLLTGTYPGVHGMNRLLVDRLPKALPYLPQILSEAGYQTAAILNTGMVNDKPLRMGRGFDEMHELYRLRQDGSLDSIEEPEARARLVFDEYIEPMVTHESGRPWFVYLHEHDPHSPYRAPAPWNALYDFGYSRWLDTLSSNFIRAMSPTDPQRLLDEADVRHLKSRYMAEISFMDAYLGELRRQLDVQGLLERTLLLFVSDHGEAFLEHGLLGHGYSAHVEQLKIPMILSLPGVLPRGERVDSLVELVDLPPTVLQLIGVEIPSAMQGRSLLPLVFAPDSFRPERRSFGRTMNSSHRSLVRGRWHLIRAEPTGPLIGAQFELYDLESDPTEQLDRWMQREVTGRALRAMLERQDRVNQEWAKLPGGLASDGGDLLMEDLDPELRENLRDLGYLE
jgi:arylsulfatase A-like enzyme